MSADSPKTACITVNPPSWLNVELIEKALNSDCGDNANIKVQDITINGATAPGDNYGSSLYRVNAVLANNAGERSLLVKTMPEGEAMAQAVVEIGAFKTEAAMVARNIPAMKALLDEACPGRFPPFAARCLLHGSSPSPFLVLEDLKPQGFRLAERRRGLGLRHSLLAIRTLARFHAASAALLEKDPSVANEFLNPFKNGNSQWEDFIPNVVQMSADVCRTWPGYEEYADALERIKGTISDHYTKLNDPSPGKFNVLLHGDYWTNNMMFKYTENEQLSDFRVVDLQITRVASPAIDLLYFLSTSVSEDISERHEGLLIREYHVALTETLHLLGLRGPSFKELTADINAHGAYTFFGALGVWPIARTVRVPDLNAAVGDFNSTRFLYETEDMKRWLQKMLPEYKRRGWMQF